jgi:phage terminase large subunit-like protein
VLSVADVEAGARSFEAEQCCASLRFFFERAWQHVEPTRALMPSVATDAFCAAGQAVGDGRIKRLGVETCPGTAKSLFWSVIFPAWLLLRERGRARVMAGSYAWGFAERDALRCRTLVQGEWYQSLVAALADAETPAWGIREDANKKGDWWTTASGRRLISSVDGRTVGERCTWQIIDDPLSAADIFSVASKAEAKRWCFESMQSRLEDQRTDPRVMVMQRLDVDDPMGEARKRGWTILSLPAVLGMWGVPAEGCVLLADDGTEVWRDTRAVGEPIVDLLDLPTLERLRSSKELGPKTFSTQYLQRAGDGGLALFKRTYWNWYAPRGVALTADRPPDVDLERPARRPPEAFDRMVITADLTFGSEEGDYAVVQAWGADGSDRYLLKQKRGRAGFERSKQWILDLHEEYPEAQVCIEKAANGWAVLEQVKKIIAGVKGLKTWGKKKQRHAAAVPSVEEGNCFLPLGETCFIEVDLEGAETYVDAECFVEEHAKGKPNDDQMDASSYAIIELNRGVTDEADGGQEIVEGGDAMLKAMAGVGADPAEIAKLADLL